MVVFLLQVYITVVFYMKKITICPKTLYRKHNWENKNVVPNSPMFLIAPPHPNILTNCITPVIIHMKAIQKDMIPDFARKKLVAEKCRVGWGY